MKITTMTDNNNLEENLFDIRILKNTEDLSYAVPIFTATEHSYIILPLKSKTIHAFAKKRRFEKTVRSIALHTFVSLYAPEFMLMQCNRWLHENFQYAGTLLSKIKWSFIWKHLSLFLRKQESSTRPTSIPACAETTKLSNHFRHTLSDSWMYWTLVMRGFEKVSVYGRRPPQGPKSFQTAHAPPVPGSSPIVHHLASHSC